MNIYLKVNVVTRSSLKRTYFPKSADEILYASILSYANSIFLFQGNYAVLFQKYII